MRSLAISLVRELLGLISPVPAHVPVDPLYADYLARCDLARRGFRVDHLIPELAEATPAEAGQATRLDTRKE